MRSAVCLCWQLLRGAGGRWERKGAVGWLDRAAAAGHTGVPLDGIGWLDRARARMPSLIGGVSTEALADLGILHGAAACLAGASRRLPALVTTATVLMCWNGRIDCVLDCHETDGSRIVPVDDARALSYLQQAAADGSPVALHQLGWRYVVRWPSPPCGGVNGDKLGRGGISRLEMDCR